MNEYYGVSPSSDFFAHYGVKGMKWGVRKALERGDIKAVRKHYLKAQKKLAKLEKMGVNSKKYAARAAAYGTGAAIAGGLAAAGTEGLANGVMWLGPKVFKKKIVGPMKRSGGKLTRITATASDKKKHMELIKAAAKENEANLAKYTNQANAIRDWGKNIGYPGEKIYKESKAPSIKAAQEAFNKNRTIANYNALSDTKKNKFHIGDVSNDTIARIGAGALAAGLGAAAARNVYKAKHGAKYRAQAEQFRNAINETFDGIDMSQATPRKRKRR